MSAVPADIDGETRPAGPATDIGADEFRVAPPTITLDPVETPTNMESQRIAGTTNAGATVTVTTDTAASDGAATMNGSNWSYTITGLVWGANNVTVIAGNGTGSTTVKGAVISRCPKLEVTLEGSGGGRVESDPAAINCPSGACSALFGFNTNLRLFPTPDGNSILSGWSACAGLGDCSFHMDGDQEVTAFFVLKPAWIPSPTSSYYTSIGDAYSHLEALGGTIESREFLFEEDVILSRPIPVVLDGGNDKSYAGKTGRTSIAGRLTVQLGSLTAADVEIR